MNFEIIINDSYSIFANLLSIVLFAALLLFILLFITRMIWRKFRKYETLKYEFVTIIAHKFRTPLTQMKWIAETILEKEQDPYKVESLKSLNQSNQGLISLTGTLIELTDSAHTSLAAYNLEKIDVCKLAGSVLETLKKEFHEKNLFFGIQCSDAEIFAKADRTRLEFVIQTLLENSIRYSPTGRNVEVEVVRNRRKVQIKVIDHGIGIDPADMQSMFTKFFRAQNARSMDTEGFGVGLYLAQSIVKRHKGKIGVYSAGLGQGSTFTVTLPLAK
ncbi:MAG: HAMP domain-containing sensor histidine kinase [Patescibacteria group bacterium]